MTTHVCPQGHDSSESDYCSECGIKLGAPEQAPVVLPAGSGRCPDCGMDHNASDAAFCEVCGYHFLTGAHGELPTALRPPAESVAAVPVTAWEVEIAVDPSMWQESSPPPPSDFAPVRIVLDREVSLIGRRSDRRAIFPELALNHDDAVSHRHALITKAPGGLVLRDLDSSNGTAVNGKELPALADVPLQDGDRITLGYWTQMTVRAVR